VYVSGTGFSSSGKAMVTCGPPAPDKDPWNGTPSDYTLDGSLNKDGTMITELTIHIEKKGPASGYVREDKYDIKVTGLPVDLRGGAYQEKTTWVGYQESFPLGYATVELKGTMTWTDPVEKRIVMSNKITSWDAFSGTLAASFYRKVVP
jgi:hypothetical protein